MRNYYFWKSALICTLSCVAIGCGDFLQPGPKTIETTSNFYQSNDQFVQAVHGAYAGLQEWTLQAHLFLEVRSDNTTIDNRLDRGAFLGVGGGVDRFTNNERITSYESAWNTLYKGIKDVNEPLSYIKAGIENGYLERELGERLEGELKFLRAYFYFTLVRLWGNVPLLLEPVSSGIEAFDITQSNPEEILEAVEKDLTEARSVLPVSYTGDDVGRVTKGAVQVLLGEVYLWREKFDEAETELRAVVNAGTYSLLQDYSAIFSPDNKFHSESIFEVQFREGSEGESSNFMFQFAPVHSYPDIVPVAVGTWGRNLPTLDLVNSYETGDIRKEVSIGSFYRAQDDTNVAYIRKWDQTPNSNFPRQDYNWPLFRYADVLLMLAEAINEQRYDSGEPFDLINQIRSRANLSLLTPVDLPDQESFKMALLQERRFELAFENKRWFDLIRFGKAVEIMITHGELETANPTTPINPVFPLVGLEYKIEPYMLVYPIPDGELIVNPNMEQNEGY